MCPGEHVKLPVSHSQYRSSTVPVSSRRTMATRPAIRERPVPPPLRSIIVRGLTTAPTSARPAAAGPLLSKRRCRLADSVTASSRRR
ncbi:hypothetical protein EVAR_48726_1 [Eumeta japonica]|uniref:Uncharacterized protein n=1 Tax=Eumeta variegata TaxID=151549 RepID=A0A4C1T2Y7_EUMVA|nr:hypothetical protein EVAR_48726_1 [Eumeta japonica]